MATTKITITLETEQVEAMRKLVGTKQTRSVSAFVKHAVNIALQDASGWAAMLGQALEETGGPVTKKERAWADSILTGSARPPGKRRRAA
jgi:Arc/MetJ-type ribon-helix-helix transcriptional regulator